jgi:hypothetical protein
MPCKGYEFCDDHLFPVITGACYDGRLLLEYWQPVIRPLSFTHLSQSDPTIDDREEPMSDEEIAQIRAEQSILGCTIAGVIAVDGRIVAVPAHSM